MLQIRESGLRVQLVEEHSESRKRMIGMRARLDAFSAALDLAAAHVDCAIQGVETPSMEDAFRDIPTSEELVSVCAAYRQQLDRLRKFGAALAEIGE